MYFWSDNNTLTWIGSSPGYSVHNPTLPKVNESRGRHVIKSYKFKKTKFKFDFGSLTFIHDVFFLFTIIARFYYYHKYVDVN